MSLPLISQMPQDLATVVLLGLLLVAFVVAFKIMKMVFETILVTVLSAGFYVAITQLMNYSFSFNSMLTYSFMGASLYMGYTFLASAFFVVEKAISIPYRLVKLILIPFKKAYEEISEEVKLRKFRRDTEKDKDSSTKQVVVDKLKDEDED